MKKNIVIGVLFSLICFFSSLFYFETLNSSLFALSFSNDGTSSISYSFEPKENMDSPEEFLDKFITYLEANDLNAYGYGERSSSYSTKPHSLFIYSNDKLFLDNLFTSKGTMDNLLDFEPIGKEFNHKLFNRLIDYDISIYPLKDRMKYEDSKVYGDYTITSNVGLDSETLQSNIRRDFSDYNVQSTEVFTYQPFHLRFFMIMNIKSISVYVFAISLFIVYEVLKNKDYYKEHFNEGYTKTQILIKILKDRIVVLPVMLITYVLLYFAVIRLPIFQPKLFWEMSFQGLIATIIVSVVTTSLSLLFIKNEGLATSNKKARPRFEFNIAIITLLVATVTLLLPRTYKVYSYISNINAFKKTPEYLASNNYFGLNVSSNDTFYEDDQGAILRNNEDTFVKELIDNNEGFRYSLGHVTSEEDSSRSIQKRELWVDEAYIDAFIDPKYSLEGHPGFVYRGSIYTDSEFNDFLEIERPITFSDYFYTFEITKLSQAEIAIQVVDTKKSNGVQHNRIYSLIFKYEGNQTEAQNYVDSIRNKYGIKEFAPVVSFKDLSIRSLNHIQEFLINELQGVVPLMIAAFALTLIYIKSMFGLSAPSKRRKNLLLIGVTLILVLISSYYLSRYFIANMYNLFFN